MSGPLHGIKILGFTHFAQAPFALQLLGDLGADVINIERPKTGDFNRAFLADEKLNGEGPFFLAMNRNKRSLTLDLKKSDAKEIAFKLIAKSDVVVSNYRPGVLDKLGIGFEEAKKVNDSIIYCEALGYGETGPYANLPGQDLLAQSLSGYASIVGHDGAPQSGGGYLVDLYSALLLTIGVTSAIVNKKNGGKAQKVGVNLLNSALHLQSQELGYYMNTGRLPKRPARHSGHVWQESPYGIYKTQNGYMSLATNASEKPAVFGEIIGVKGLPELMPDKATMLKNRDALYDTIAPALEKQTTEYWLEKFREVGFWCAKVNNYEDVLDDPQVLHNGIIQEIEHPVAGRIKVVGAPIDFSETPADIRLAPPLLGQHNEEILSSLGYSEQDVKRFKEEGLF
ncbi:CoA transferase [Synergistales bacterium]|nr:CoA transferase [Synergistales bacterium]